MCIRDSVTKSQVAFARGRTFAWAWVPDRYLGGGHAPLVLSVALSHRDDSPRWKPVSYTHLDVYKRQEEGILSDAETDGLALRWGDAQAMLAALEAMAFRRGRLGNLLAEGLSLIHI